MNTDDAKNTRHQTAIEEHESHGTCLLLVTCSCGWQSRHVYPNKSLAIEAESEHHGFVYRTFCAEHQGGANHA